MSWPPSRCLEATTLALRTCLGRPPGASRRCLGLQVPRGHVLAALQVPRGHRPCLEDMSRPPSRCLEAMSWPPGASRTNFHGFVLSLSLESSTYNFLASPSHTQTIQKITNSHSNKLILIYMKLIILIIMTFISGAALSNIRRAVGACHSVLTKRCFQASCEGGRGQCRQTQFSW